MAKVFGPGRWSMRSTTSRRTLLSAERPMGFSDLLPDPLTDLSKDHRRPGALVSGPARSSSARSSPCVDRDRRTLFILPWRRRQDHRFSTRPWLAKMPPALGERCPRRPQRADPVPGVVAPSSSMHRASWLSNLASSIADRRLEMPLRPTCFVCGLGEVDERWWSRPRAERPWSESWRPSTRGYRATDSCFAFPCRGRLRFAKPVQRPRYRPRVHRLRRKSTCDPCRREGRTSLLTGSHPPRPRPHQHHVMTSAPRLGG